MKFRKVCPIVLRNEHSGVQFLAFEHPLAGRQLVKGTVEPGEPAAAAAARELEEESGLSVDSRKLKLIAVSEGIVAGQEWVFFETYVSNLPDSWSFRSNDDRGRLFSFFWQDFGAPLDDRWHQSFHAALDFYKRRKAEA